MEKRFAYKFLKKLLKYVDSAQEFIAHLGMVILHTAGPEYEMIIVILLVTFKYISLFSHSRGHGC